MMLEHLNKEQISAVKQVDGPVIVFAGAGSGKTRTLTYRIAYMIKEKKIPSFTILAITFTNKATNEMRQRLNELIGEDADGLTVSTFHSLFAKILRREIHHIGYLNSFTIVDEEDQIKVINEVIEELKLDKKKFHGRRMQKVINYLKSQNIKSVIPVENEILNAYEAKMKENNLLDFEDLLLKTHELFITYPSVLAKYQQRYRYILVDEFQDTNKTQYEIVKLLTKHSRNLFVVGDDDQSIYRFRGADYTNIKSFKADYPEHKTFHLTQNYRSTQAILDGCNSLIKNNFSREEKELWSSAKGSSDDCVIKQVYNHDEEVNYVIENIKQLYKKNQNYNDFAILYRNSPLLRNFELGLIKENIPYRIFGGISYLRRKEIKDVMAYLKLIINNNDLFSFKRIVNEPSRGIGQKTISQIEELYNQYNDLPTAIRASQAVLSKSRYNILNEFMDLIIELGNKMDNMALIEFYDLLLDKTLYRQMLIEEGDNEERLVNLEEFKSILYKFDNDGQIASAKEKLQLTFDEAMLSEERTPSINEYSDAVTLSTVHSSKGLEFRYVFFVGLDEGIFPSFSNLDSLDDLEEERRVAYVGATRAKEKLFLISARQRLMYGDYNFHRPSRFIREFQEGLYVKTITEPPVDKPISNINSNTQKTNIKNSSIYKVSDKIVHDVYGEGTIVGINDKIGFIVFLKDSKIRKFDLTHPSISKKE